MEFDDYLASIRNDADKMIEAARTVGLDAPVPTCSGWSVRHLIVHTGVVHRHKTETIRGDYTDGPAPLADNPEGDVIEWYEEGVDEMLAVFMSHDLGRPTWTWCNHDHTADWWVRRMAHETAIHSADALIAADQTPTIDPTLATDGIDEILDEFMTGSPPWSDVIPGDRTISLSAADRAWTLRTASFTGTSPTTGTAYDAVDTVVYDAGANPEAIVRTDPRTLDLWLWGRGELPKGSIEGDRSLVEHLRAVASEATQ